MNPGSARGSSTARRAAPLPHGSPRTSRYALQTRVPASRPESGSSNPSIEVSSRRKSCRFLSRERKISLFQRPHRPQHPHLHRSHFTAEQRPDIFVLHILKTAQDQDFPLVRRQAIERSFQKRQILPFRRIFFRPDCFARRLRSAIVELI